MCSSMQQSNVVLIGNPTARKNIVKAFTAAAEGGNIANCMEHYTRHGSVLAAEYIQNVR